MKKIVGRMHSIETLGTRDGPGLRCVFFLAGCNFRCRFCQNPDTWSVRGSDKMTLAQAKSRLLPLLPYLRQRGGGVTASGGEPTLQADFVRALFRLAHDLGLSTALDTNGSCAPSKRAALLRVTDRVLLDVKASRDALHRRLTGRPLGPTLAFGRLAAGKPGRLRIRRVLLPGLNDDASELHALADYALGLPHLPDVELIPYHRLGAHKWRELGLAYPLDRMIPPTAARLRRATALLARRGLAVVPG